MLKSWCKAANGVFLAVVVFLHFSSYIVVCSRIALKRLKSSWLQYEWRFATCSITEVSKVLVPLVYLCIHTNIIATYKNFFFEKISKQKFIKMRKTVSAKSKHNFNILFMDVDCASVNKCWKVYYWTMNKTRNFHSPLVRFISGKQHEQTDGEGWNSTFCPALGE